MVAAPARAASSWPWFLSATLLLIFSVGSWVIGPQFVFGERHAERPIWTFLALYGMGWAGFALAALSLHRNAPPPFFLIVGVAAITRCVLLDSNLIQASDVYRYVLDGEAIVNGVNPYRYAPADVLEGAPEPFQEQLQAEEGRRILERVSYPDIRTIYPPMAQLAFAAGAWLSPWDWQGQRIVFVLFDAATIAMLLALLKHLQLPQAWVLVYAWNPLVLKEVSNSAHLDSMVAFCLVSALYTAARGESDERIRWPLLSGVALSGAVLCKLYPLILVPAFAAFWLARTHRLRSLAAFLSILIATVAAAYAPFLNVGLDAVTEGLRRYSAEWRRNDGLFAFIALMSPTHARTVANAIVATGAIASAVWLHRKKGNARSLIATIQFTLLTWLMFLPSPYPWYAIALLAVCALRPQPWAIVLSGAMAVYYYSFIHEYRDHPDHWLAIAQAIEHGLILLALVAPAIIRPANKQADHRPPLT